MNYSSKYFKTHMILFYFQLHSSINNEYCVTLTPHCWCCSTLQPQIVLSFFRLVATPALAVAVAALRRHQQVAAPVCSPSFLIWYSGMLQWPSDAVWQARQGSGCLCQSRSITPSSGRTTPSSCGKVTGCAQARPDEVSGEVSAATGAPLTGALVSSREEEEEEETTPWWSS